MEVQKKAQDLADAIINSHEYQRMTNARQKVDEHEAARIMLRDFQALQAGLHKQQMEGEALSPGQEEQLQNLFAVISVNPYIRELFEAEFAFSGLMMTVNDVLSKVLDLRDEEEEEPEEAPDLKVPKKRILIPGKDV